jgi:hypothetical protein
MSRLPDSILPCDLSYSCTRGVSPEHIMHYRGCSADQSIGRLPVYQPFP